MKVIDYGLLVVYLRATFITGDGDGGGGLSRLTGINYVSLHRYTRGRQPRPRQKVALRRAARARLTAEQRHQAGMMVERVLGAKPGMEPRDVSRDAIDWSVLTETLRETYPPGQWYQFSIDVGADDQFINRWGRDLPYPSVVNQAAVLRVAYQRLTDAEFDQCLIRADDRQEAA